MSVTKLMTTNNAKTTKGEKKDILTGILYLSPADESGVMNVCPRSTAGCRAGCLHFSGRAGMFKAGETTNYILEARKRRTEWLKNDRKGFMAQLEKDIDAIIRQANRLNYGVAFRMNGTSDLPFLALNFAKKKKYKDIQFYDYTKIEQPYKRILPNYYLTFSRSESNYDDCIDALENGINVSVVFDVKKAEQLPKTFWGRKVINGDETDLRFLDEKGVIIGLIAKGKSASGRKNSVDTFGFVQKVSAFGGIAV